MTSNTPSSNPYTGPPVTTMLRDKTLAENIILYHSHPTSASILDNDNLELLRAFVNDPSQREQLLAKEGIDVNESLKGRQASLAAYAVWAHGRGEGEEVLKEEDVEMLKRWFGEGQRSG